MKALFVATSLLLVTNVVQAQQKSLIKGQVEGLASGKIHLIVRSSESRWDTLRTVAFTNKGFSIQEIDVSEPLAARLSIDGYQGGFSFFLEPGVNYQATLRDGELYPITGGVLQNRQIAFEQGQRKLILAVANLQQRCDSLRKALRYGSASKLNDSIKVLQTELETRRTTFMADNDNILSAHLQLQQIETQDSPLNICRQLYAQLGERAKQSRSGVILQQRIARLSKVSKGSPAPDFTLPTLEGTSFTLSKMKGRVKIVDFWASWCGPCRLNNPILKQLYAEFHRRGLEIVNVSLDDNRERWVAAVQKDGLNWTQTSSLKAWNDPVAKLYNVTAIPAIFVLDADNNIMATGLHGESLKAFVAALFGKNN